MSKKDINIVIADLAESIVRVADLGNQINKSPLTEEALVMLIQSKIGASNITKTQIKNVLWALPRLEDYLK